MTPHPDDDTDVVDPLPTRNQFITEVGEEPPRAQPEAIDRIFDTGAATTPVPRHPPSTARSGEMTGARAGGPHHRPGSIEVGQTLYDKYHVLRRLGGGAMGDVWLVRHLSLNRNHALKVIVPHLAAHPGALKRFQREFQVMASFHHEHAIEVYDARLDEEGGYIDMQYVEGQTIHDVLANARCKPGRDRSAPLMPFPWILRVLGQLCEVLDLAHQSGIVHRDLKPSNLMLLARRPPGREFLKVLDFGIAKIRHDPENKLNDATLTGGFIGTPSYSSPEQVYSRPVDGRADLYSVGVMLYEIVSGRLPFVGPQTLVMLDQAQKPPPPFAAANPDLVVAPEIERAILRMLAKEPDARPATAQALFEEFHEAVTAHHPQAISGYAADSSPDMTPPTWDSVPYYSPPLDPTEPEPEPKELPSTEEATAPAPSVAPARPPSTSDLTRKLPPPPDSGQWPTLLPPPLTTPRPRWRKAVAAFAPLAILILLAPLAIRAIRPPAVASRGSAEIDADKGKVRKYVPPGPPPSPGDLLPEGYLAVKGLPDIHGWPARIRRKDEVNTYQYHDDGIYLPIDFEPLPGGGSPELAEDGWPRVIVRKGDRTQARYIRIRGGIEFVMGAWNAPNAIDGRADAPAHPVILPGFYMQEHEVNNGQIEDYFANNFNRPRPVEWEASFDELKRAVGQDEARTHPAVSLSRKEAVYYAQSFGARLPTEAQWEYAARSLGSRRQFVWGDERPTRELANIFSQGAGVQTAPSCSYPRDVTVQGLCDMTGNVQEWCRDAFGPYRRSALPERNPCVERGDADPVLYVIRGAAYDSPPGLAELTRREDRFPEAEKRANLGFRVVIECPEIAAPRR